MPCVFCQIVNGERPSRTIYSTDTTHAFLDANPLAPGHTLVIPTDHYERLNDLPPDTAKALMQTIHHITPAIETATDAPATTIAINNGTTAGQEIPHTHWHIIPRTTTDHAGPIHGLFQDPPTLTNTELDAIHDAITTTL